ncbi:MAG: alpha/beta fold hydrolase [Deltaproteobacteria bacterium]|nr:alpha/beta fold hydrolase [Deltaproteobacteria bacterium]
MSFLFLHGLLGGPASWRTVVLAAGIADRAECQVLPGHGPEPRPCGDSFDDAVDAIAGRLGGGPPRILVGYSMGARVGLRLLLRHPHRFARAILIGLHPGSRSDAEREARVVWEKRERAFLLDEGLETFVSRWERLPILRPARPLPAPVEARRRQVRLGHTAAGIADAIGVLGLGSMPSSWDAIADSTIPVHLMAGAADEKFCALGREARSRNAAWTFEAVPGAAHDVALEAPAALIRALERTSEGGREQ